MEKTSEETWRKIEETVTIYRNFGESITQNYPEWSEISEEDREKYHLDVPIEELSLLPDGTSGCTPEGLLKKTIGMSREDLPKQLY